MAGGLPPIRQENELGCPVRNAKIQKQSMHPESFGPFEILARSGTS